MITWEDVRDREQDMRELEPEEESEAEARRRMLPAELAADDAYAALVRRRAQPLRELGSRAQWGTWRRKKAGGKRRAER